MTNGSEAGVVIEKEPVYIDPSLIWTPGMGIPSVPSIIVPVSMKPSELKSLVVDIETTGANPWDSRIMCIGFLDPANLGEEPTVIMYEDESKILIEFLEYFVNNEYNEIIGYNLAFDFRFIFAKCLFYRIPCKEWTDAALYDIMQVLTQVKQAFVYGNLKSGSLDDWMYFLFDLHKPMTIEELLTAYELKDWPPIIEYNKNDVVAETLLYAIIQLVLRQNFSLGSINLGSQSETWSETSTSSPELPAFAGSGESTWVARCSNCYAEKRVPVSQPTYRCQICGTMISMTG